MVDICSLLYLEHVGSEIARPASFPQYLVSHPHILFPRVMTSHHRPRSKFAHLIRGTVRINDVVKLVLTGKNAKSMVRPAMVFPP